MNVAEIQRLMSLISQAGAARDALDQEIRQLNMELQTARVSMLDGVAELQQAVRELEGSPWSAGLQSHPALLEPPSKPQKPWRTGRSRSAVWSKSGFVPCPCVLCFKKS